MGPRPSASENPRPATTEGSAPAASMGPRPSASENAAARDALDHHGIASMGPRPSASENMDAVATLRAADELQWGRGHRPRKTSSPAPTRTARRTCFNGAEAIGLGKPPVASGTHRLWHSFNGAEAIGLGKPATVASARATLKELQWGRGHRPRKTGRRTVEACAPAGLQWGRGHRPRKTP